MEYSLHSMECSVDGEYHTSKSRTGDSESQDLGNEVCSRSAIVTGCSSNEHCGSEPATLPAVQSQKRRKHRCKCVANTAAVIALMLIIAALFTVPVIVFELNTQESTDTGCVAELYTGEVCRTELAARQACIPGRESNQEVFVSLSAAQQAIGEQNLQSLLVLPSPRPSCARELNMFLCTVVFDGLCDTEGRAHQPTRGECETLISTACDVEYQKALQVPSLSAVFDCGSLPLSSSICESTVVEGSSNDTLPYLLGSAMDNGSVNTSNGSLSCSEGFTVDEELGLCKPVCGKWRPQSDEEGDKLMAVTITAGALGIALSILVLLLACFHYKTTFKFPGIFIVYQVLSGFTYLIVYLINYVDVQHLFCNSKDLLENLMEGNETSFCIITAAAWIYLSSQVALWWIFHLSLAFCGVFWPYKYQFWKKSGYFKYTHIVMVLLGLLIPLIPVIICYSVGGYVQYTLVRPDCVARNSRAAFYSHVVPLLMIVATGFFLLVLIFWKFFSQDWMCKSSTLSHHKTTRRQVEVKIFFLLCFYIVVWTDVFVTITATLVQGEEYREAVTDHFTCEAVTPGNCSKSVFDKFDVGSKILAYCLVCLYPAVFLIYFVRIKKCKPAHVGPNTTASVSTESD